MIIKKSSFELNKNQNEILSLCEASEFLKLAKSSVYKLTSAKKIPHFVPGGKRIYFKKSDLEDWVFKNRIPPNSEFEADAESYLCQTSKKSNNE